MEHAPKSWASVLLFTVAMTTATAIGTYFSSFLLLSAKMKEEAEKARVERLAKGTAIHCEKLQLSASLTAEIDFSADRGYPNRILLTDLRPGITIESLRKVKDEVVEEGQLALERRASELIPFLTEEEADVLSRVTLHHYVVTQMRTSKVPKEQRVSPSEGGFNANVELDGIRKGAAKLAAIYRNKCTDTP